MSWIMIKIKINFSPRLTLSRLELLLLYRVPLPPGRSYGRFVITTRLVTRLCPKYHMTTQLADTPFHGIRCAENVACIYHSRLPYSKY